MNFLKRQECLLAIAEYVGANVNLKLSPEMKMFISSFNIDKRYPIVYRFWTNISLEKIKDSIKNVNSYKVQEAHSYTTNLESIKEMYSELDYDDSFIITHHFGFYGFDPIYILEKGLEEGLAGDESVYIFDVIRSNKYQKEAYIYEPIFELTKRDIYGTIETKNHSISVKKGLNLNMIEDIRNKERNKMKRIKEKKKEILTVTDEVRISEDIILEKGDRIQLVNEKSDISLNSLKRGYYVYSCDEDNVRDTGVGFEGDINNFESKYKDTPHYTVLEHLSPKELSSLILSGKLIKPYTIYYTYLTKRDIDEKWLEIASTLGITDLSDTF